MRYILFLLIIFFAGCKEEREYNVATQNNISSKIIANSSYKNTLIANTQDLKPSILSSFKTIVASGVVKDMVYKNGILYIATDSGSVDIFKDNQLVDKILIPSYKDNLYKEQKVSTIFSFDAIDDKSIIICSDEVSSKSPYLYQNKKFEKLSIDGTIIKARFLDNDKIIFGLLSNEIVLYDITNRKEVYRKKISESSFSDMKIDMNKKRVVIGAESGVLYILDATNGTVLETIEDINKDKTYKVDINNNFVLSANQDGSARIFDISKKTYKEFNASFLVYSGAISPDDSKVIFSINEKNDFIVLDMLRDKSYLLSGHKSTPNTSIFVDENTIYTSSDDEHIMMWKLPQ